MTELRLATRRSPLALAQAELAAKALAEVGVLSRVIPVVASGDRDRVTPVTELTQMGAFVRAVQDAVLSGEADVAVHSAKDLPVTGPEGLRVFHLRRGPAWDVMCGAVPDSLPSRARVGTGSPRRSAQLRRMRPDVEVVGIRGNVGSRLDRVDSGALQAVVLAEAGLERLGLSDRIGHRFALDEMVPAPAQGAIALEARADHGEVVEMLEAVDDHTTGLAVAAERRLLAVTGAGCRSALGAFAGVSDRGEVEMVAFVQDDRGARRTRVSAGSADEVAEAARRELGL